MFRSAANGAGFQTQSAVSCCGDSHGVHDVAVILWTYRVSGKIFERLNGRRGSKAMSGCQTSYLTAISMIGAALQYDRNVL